MFWLTPVAIRPNSARLLTDPAFVAELPVADGMRRVMAFVPPASVMSAQLHETANKTRPQLQASAPAVQPERHAAAPNVTRVAKLTPPAAPAPASAPPPRPQHIVDNAVPLPRPSPVRRDIKPAHEAPKVALAVPTEPPAGKAARLADEPVATSDHRTAVYDIAAHTVYLPNGEKLEAHSGIGHRRDDPRFVKAHNRGPTPPNVYELSLRERLFHGVRAIRLTPVNEEKMFGRDGMLAHTYMLGPSGQSNGCVSFRNYRAFLKAYLKGEVTRMVVVPRLRTTVASAARHGERYAFNSR